MKLGRAVTGTHVSNKVHNIMLSKGFLALSVHHLRLSRNKIIQEYLCINDASISLSLHENSIYMSTASSKSSPRLVMTRAGESCRP